MPVPKAPGLILVTGANGYVATWVVRALLEKGFSVRAGVRTLEKARFFKEDEWSRGYVQEGRLTFVIIGDMAEVCVVVVSAIRVGGGACTCATRSIA